MGYSISQPLKDDGSLSVKTIPQQVVGKIKGILKESYGSMGTYLGTAPNEQHLQS